METGNPHQTAHWKRWLFAIWVLMCCALIAFRWQNIHFLILADTDDNLRLAQVKARAANPDPRIWSAFMLFGGRIVGQ